jgi:hypothetical protein
LYIYAVLACVKADRFSSICQVILSNLKLDIYGQLTIGTMTFSRKVIYTYQATTSTYQACSHFYVLWVLDNRSHDYRRSWRHLHGGKISSPDGAPQVTATPRNYEETRVKIRLVLTGTELRLPWPI